MANTSTVIGDITLKGQAKSVHAFLKLMEVFEQFTYSTEIQAYDLEDIVELPETEEIERTYVLVAMGKWHYERTLNDMFKGLVETRIEYDMGSEPTEIEWTDTMDQAWLILDKVPIDVEIDYNEFELGVGLLLKSNTSIYWTKGKLENVQVIENNLTNYEVNAENIYNLMDERNFDYTSYTVKQLDEIENIDWDRYIQKHIVNPPITKQLKNKESKEHQLFIEQLKEQLESNTETKAFWNDIDEWFEDEFIQESIMNII